MRMISKAFSPNIAYFFYFEHINSQWCFQIWCFCSWIVLAWDIKAQKIKFANKKEILIFGSQGCGPIKFNKVSLDDVTAKII